MNKPGSPLNDLWQQQQIDPIDVKQLQKDFFRQQLKQRLYMFMDIMSMVFFVAVLFWAWSKMDSLEIGIMVGLFIITVPFVAYLVWLRRHAAFGQVSDTRDYIDSLVRQMRNNARIAFLTKHSAWVTELFMLLFNGLMYWQGNIEAEKVNSVLVILGVTTLGMIGFYVWAHRRQQRFEREKARLQALMAQQ